MNIVQLLKFFKKRDCSLSSKFLLAFSGGPDSMALLHALLEVRKKLPFSLELAHVDHKQRPESTKEARELCALAEKLGLPFHLKEISQKPTGNLEDFYRDERYQFFKRIYHDGSFDALLLAHQRDDLEETALKRILEGANLDRIGGMRPESEFRGMRVLRPLLHTRKEDLLNYLKERGAAYIEDYTNQDTRFLRARMREDLIPSLEKSFGKSIRSSLVKHAERSNHLDDYINRQVLLKLKEHESALGTYYEFIEPLHHLELDYLLRGIAKKYNVTLSHEQIKAMIWACEAKTTGHSLNIGGRNLFIDRGRLFLLDPIPNFEGSILLEPGKHRLGNWDIEIDSSDGPTNLGWEGLFSENPEFFLTLPKKEGYQLRAPNIKEDRFYFRKSLSKWLAEHKIPQKLGSLLPVIEQDSGLTAEFLTGKTPFMIQGEFLSLKLSYRKEKRTLSERKTRLKSEQTLNCI